MFELLTENNISFPDGFLWGTGTAGHQIEGNNIHSQRWNEELADRVRYPEVSAEACGSWERFRRDAGWPGGMRFASLPLFRGMGTD